LTYVMARKDPISYTIEKKVKDSMEAWLWTHRLEDLL
jgi:hypothetical protein